MQSPSRHCFALTPSAVSNPVLRCNARFYRAGSATCLPARSRRRRPWCLVKSSISMSLTAVLDGVQPDVWADVYLFQNCDERLLASVLAQLQRDGLESNETTVWLHEQLCVRRTDPTYRLFLPARLLAETVCIVPHPQRWANSKGFSLVLRR